MTNLFSYRNALLITELFFSGKKLLQTLTKTTFVVVVDDVKMTESFTEFILHVQGGLLQGSSQSAIDCP